MGQPVDVSVKETLDPDVRVFETDRWLTGMGNGLFESAQSAPEGTMARRVFEVGDVEAVHVYGNCLTVTKSRRASWDSMSDEIKKSLENFYIFYPENIGKKVEAFTGDDGDDGEDGEAADAGAEDDA